MSSNGQRVLVVDDEPQILRALRATLRGAGYTVDSAATAEEALTAAAAHPPEAVILDLVLPDGSGTDVCRELRSWSDAPVIVLSAVGEEREKIAALDAGADDYVTKPFSVDELLARLRAVLRRRSGGAPEPVIEVGEPADRRRRADRHPRRRAREAQLRTSSTSCACWRRTAASCSRTVRCCARCGAPRTRSRRTTSTSTSRISAARSSRTRRARATCSPRPEPGYRLVDPAQGILRQL